MKVTPPAEESYPRLRKKVINFRRDYLFIFFSVESSQFFLCLQAWISRFADKNARRLRNRCSVPPCGALFYRRLNKPRRYNISSRMCRNRCRGRRSPRINNWSCWLWARSYYRLRWRSNSGSSCRCLFHPCWYRNSDDRPYAQARRPLPALKPSMLHL